MEQLNNMNKTAGKVPKEPLKLDMDFDEAMRRALQVKQEKPKKNAKRKK